jgi:hypothetical protein
MYSNPDDYSLMFNRKHVSSLRNKGWFYVKEQRFHYNVNIYTHRETG